MGNIRLGVLGLDIYKIRNNFSIRGEFYTQNNNNIRTTTQYLNTLL